MSRNLRLLLILLLGTVSVSAIALGRWQLRRLDERKALNARMLAARELLPIDLNSSGPGLGSVVGRRVGAKGSFDPTRQILIRGRVQDQAPGLEVVTPFRLEEGQGEVWVIRGFVQSPDAATPPEPLPRPDTGTVTINGLAVEPAQRGDSGQPLLRGTVTTWARLDRDAMHALAPQALPFAIQLAGDSAGVGQLPVVPPAALTNGPHLSYAIQWFGIALSALVFGVIFLRRDGPGSVQPPEAP